jgi:hypothetical protein
MYIKIAWHVDEEGVTNPSGDPEIPDGLVVPKHNCVFETNRAEYRKIRVHTEKEFFDWLRNCNYEHIMMGPELLEETPEHGIEFLFVRIYDGDENVVPRSRVFIFPNSYLYVMNKEGKTIDSVICR